MGGGIHLGRKLEKRTIRAITRAASMAVNAQAYAGGSGAGAGVESESSLLCFSGNAIKEQSPLLCDLVNIQNRDLAVISL